MMLKEQQSPVGRTEPILDLSLPVLEKAAEIKRAIAMNDVVVITGETGSGKTTEIPLMILESVGLKGKVAVTQPRVIAARSVAEFVAKQMKTNIGEEVGYHVRFDDKTSEGTNINFMTEGILLKMMEGDPLLSDYSAVMVDEVHERNIDTDLILGMVKRIQPLRKERGLDPLKVVVTSATLEKEKLSDFFDAAPMIEVKGRTFSVDIDYIEPEVWLDDDMTCPDATPVVENIINNGEDGDILIFVPGVSEIQKTIKKLNRIVTDMSEILPLHGQLSPEEQNKIFVNDGRRKIIVATNVAEASITVPGVKHVIDTGLVRRMVFDPNTGISSLVTMKQSQDCCDQRAGRAGRVSKGKCYRLYSKEDYEMRDKYRKPEIQLADLSGVILRMKSLEIDDIASFDFIDNPGEVAIEAAIETLTRLGALDDNGDLTSLGREMMKLPLEPHLAKMVVESKKYDCEAEIATIAAFVGAKPVFRKVNEEDPNYNKMKSAYEAFQDKTSDFLTLLNVWKGYEASGFSDQWARDRFLNAKALREIGDIKNQLFKILSIDKTLVEKKSGETIAKIMAMGLVDNLMMKTESFGYIKVDELGYYHPYWYYIYPGSVMFDSSAEFVTSMKILGIRDKSYLSLVQRVKPEWIMEMVPHLVAEIRQPIKYDAVDDTVKRGTDYVFRENSHIFYEKSEIVTGDEVKEALAELLADGEFLTDQEKENVRNVVRTLEGLVILYRGEGNISYSQKKLIEVYRKKIEGVRSVEELKEKLQNKGIDLNLKLEDFVQSEIIEKIRLENPDQIRIGDFKYKIDYTRNRFYNGSEIVAVINLPCEEVFKDIEIPKTVFGRKTLIRLSDGQGYSTEVESGDNERLKETAARILVEKQWREFGGTHTEELKPIPVAIDNIMDDTLILPAGIVYGKDPETGRDLVSVPAVVKVGESYEVRYFLDEGQAYLAKISKSEILRQRDFEAHYAAVRRQGELKWEERMRTSQDPVDLVSSRETDDIIDEVRRIRPQQSGKPRRKALLWGELINRGLEVVHKADITLEECQKILPELKRATEEKDYSHLSAMLKSVENTEMVLRSLETDPVKTYIGSDIEGIRDFENRLMKLLEKRKGKIGDEQLEELVMSVIDEMTA